MRNKAKKFVDLLTPKVDVVDGMLTPKVDGKNGKISTIYYYCQQCQQTIYIKKNKYKIGKYVYTPNAPVAPNA